MKLKIKLTDVLLITIGIILTVSPYRQLNKRTMPSKSKGVVIGKTRKETKSIIPTVLNKKHDKHATTFRQYIDSDGRTSSSLTHSIRMGKEYYVSTGVNMRQSSYGTQDVSGSVSITKYW